MLVVVTIIMPCTADLKIDTSKPVLVTGGTGYIASVLIDLLLSKGLKVHTTVRDPSNAEKLAHLKALEDKHKGAGGSLAFFKGNLVEEGSFANAMKDCAIVFHTASPWIQEPKNPYKEVVEPAVNGTANVLNQATKTPTVKRVVLTSSALAICGDATDANDAPGGVFSEVVWNRTNNIKKGPYAYSKVMAEMKAWEIAGSQTQWKLVVINPGFVLGPGVTTHPTSESWKILKQIGDGTMASGCPAFGFGLVDVRDVAQAHMAAAFLENATGRHLVNGCNSDLFQLGQALQGKYGNDYALPKSKVNKWLLWLIAPYLGLGLTREQVWNNVDVSFKIDNTKSKEELFMTYIPMKQTCEEMFQQMIDAGMVQPKKK